MARYLIDANLPRWFSLWSSRDYVFVHDINPHWTDTEIWNYASVHGLTIVTKDADFSHRAFLQAGGPHVIHVRVGNLKLQELHRYLSSIWAEVQSTSDARRLVQVFRDRIESIG
jgi:predicted nuclease of predicted toxin-antitoxin system